jgi:hypothetical protein
VIHQVRSAPNSRAIVALVPAHNEATSIGAVIQGLLAQDRARSPQSATTTWP